MPKIENILIIPHVRFRTKTDSLEKDKITISLKIFTPYGMTKFLPLTLKIKHNKS